MPGGDLSAIARKLSALRGEERELAREIEDAATTGDELALTRSRKRHTQIRDQIAWLEDKLIPDLDA